jgi:hypothetical protein
MSLWKDGKMASNKLRSFIAAVAAVFMISDIAVAMPIAPLGDTGEMSPTLVRGGRGGGRAVAVRGGGGRAVAVRGGGGRAVAVRGGAYRGGVARGAVYRGGRNTVVVGGRGAWGRGYRWAPGGAIAAGAAIGFMTAAGAAAYATTRAPAPGLCWYYTDWTQRSGFWDVCP